MLGADLDGIRSLGAQLSATASEIADVAAPAKSGVHAVVMPDAGIDDLLALITATLDHVVSKHSSAVRALADGAAASAATYEAVEDAFTRQLGLLAEGIGQ